MSSWRERGSSGSTPSSERQRQSPLRRFWSRRSTSLRAPSPSSGGRCREDLHRRTESMNQRPSSQDGSKKRLKFASWAIGSLFLLAGLSQAKLHTSERPRTLELAKKTKRFIVTYK